MIIDRIEKEIVICEDEDSKIVELPIVIFLQPIYEGAVVKKNERGLYEVDNVETQNRRKNLENRFNSLFKENYKKCLIGGE